MRAATLCLTLFACLLVAPAHALQQTLVASDGAAGDYLGGSVAVDGDTAVVGATQNFAGPGLAYVFTRDGDIWKQTARLQGSDTQAGDAFGQSVAIDGDTIVVGAPRHVVGADQRAGAVYTFTRGGAPNRTETARLTVQAPATPNATLGSGVAIDGDVIAASAPAEGNTGQGGYGAVYLFSRAGAANRTAKARLVTTDSAAGTGGIGVGNGLAIDGNTVVVGAYTKPQTGMGQLRGAAYTFDAASTGAATETDKLLASDGAALDQFGFSVDIDGETIVVGANKDSFPNRNYVGSAYTFESSGEHNQTGKLVASDGVSDDRVGWDVAVGGAQIAVASDVHDVGTGPSVDGAGTVYLYPRSSPMSERAELSRLTAAEPGRYEYFGSGLDIDGTTLLVGSYGDRVGTNDNQGSATISYAPATAPACSDGGDNDGDGKIDFPADPGCESVNDTSEADPLPGATPTPTATPGGPAVLPPDDVDDGSKAPRIVRPRTEPPVTPTKERTIKFATVWACVDQPDEGPCKAFARVTIAYVTDDRRATFAAKKPKRLTIGSSRVTVPNGTRKPVTAKLSKQGLKLLRSRGKLKARVEMTMSRDGTAPVRATVPVTIKAPKPR